MLCDGLLEKVGSISVESKSLQFEPKNADLNELAIQMLVKREISYNILFS